MRKAAMVLQVLLGLVYLGAAIPKLAGAQEAMREQLELAPWFWGVTALAELVGVAGMVVGLKYPRVAVAGGLWVSAIMAGALVSHARVGDPAQNLVAPAVLLVLALAVAAVRGRELGAFRRSQTRPGHAVGGEESRLG